MFAFAFYLKRNLLLDHIGSGEGTYKRSDQRSDQKIEQTSDLDPDQQLTHE